MRYLIFALIFLSAPLWGDRYGGHQEREHREKDKMEIHLKEENIRDLGIKVQRVERKPSGKLIKMPAEVRENPSLTFAIYSPAEGIIRRLFVKEGDLVRKGQKLAEIFSPEIAQLVGEIEMARVKTETARRIFERDKELYQQKVIQYTRFFTSKTEYERSKGELKALMERLKSFGEVEGYHLVIRSPAKGYVVDQRVKPGDSVGPDRKLFEVHYHQVLWVYGWSGVSSSNSIKKGTQGKVITSLGEVSCSIDYIGHKVDPKTRRIPVRCIAENKGHILKPGMFVNLEVFTGGETAVVIPKRAVQDIEGKKVVFVRTDDGFEAREIHIEKEIDGYVVVEEGLKEGERIAVSGTVFLKTKLVGVEEGGHHH